MLKPRPAPDFLTWRNETRRLSELVPWDRNPRQIKDAEAKRLGESLLQFGQVQTLAVSPDGEIYDGHQRALVWSLLQEGGDREVDVRVSSRVLSEKEREKLVVYLHRGATGEWNFEALANSFDFNELVEWGFSESELVGFDFGHDEPVGEDPGADLDKAAALQAKWQVQTGQLWVMGDHRLICGDCTDPAVVARVMGGEKARYGMHDPPYGISIVGGSKPFGSIGGSKPFRSIVGSHVVSANAYTPIEGDNKEFNPTHLLLASQDIVIWGANYFADKLPCRKSWLVWDKKGREWDDNFSDCELAWTTIDTVARIYRHPWMGMIQSGEREKRQHPTQKPVAMFQKIIANLFIDDGIIIDFYLVSGTTLIACERLNRRCRAIEIEPKYCAVALERWAILTGQTPVLEKT